ncbi:dimethyladenosine transferase 2, mitochondrial [Colletes gigas]|uniref:dimethyladenosine transferase 2, mitochondrial n=1 Tax=Colletes gigas TaxID=935657 RepID=UPI001C9B18E6|nr:dimethyladenosine transferase 2, mitochondrial [Colletes gigas]
MTVLVKILNISKTSVSRTIESNNSAILRAIKKSTPRLNFTQFVNCSTAKTNNNKQYYEHYVASFLPKFKIDIIQNHLSETKNLSQLYLINPNVAKEFVLLIKDDLLKNTNHVIEMNPGLGLLTVELLNANVPFIHMYENQSNFYNELIKLCNELPERLSIKEANLIDISKTMHSKNIVKNKHNVYDLFNNVQNKEWEEESCMQLIGVVNKLGFINHLIMSTVFQTSIVMFGRPVLYLAIPPSIWNKLVNPAKRRSATHIMFQMLFNYKMFGLVDRKAFVPWCTNKAKRTQGTCDQQDIVFFHVVKLEPKPELFILFRGKQNVKNFWHFVRHNIYKPSNRIIPIMEKIVPGCGVKLIKKNYNIFTQFNDLSPIQMYDLFMEFQSWPEYETSAFVSSAAEVHKMYNEYIERV